MSKPCRIARHRREAARSRAVNNRVPHLGIDKFPNRASEMSRNLSGAFLGTAPFVSTIVGGRCPGRMASAAP
jgi:hypothetical protein